MKKRLFYILLFCMKLLASNDAELFWNTYTTALRGDKEAQFQTGVMLERGIGVDVNQTQSAKWYEKAAIQGHKDAQYNIGLMYATGRGIEQSDQLSMMWLSCAAKQGDKEARALLLALIDGKSKTKSQASSVESGMVDIIKPVRFKSKENASLCSSLADENKCSRLKDKQSFTSKLKQGSYYKISGIVTDHGWEAYEGDGWIEESMIELQ